MAGLIGLIKSSGLEAYLLKAAPLIGSTIGGPAGGIIGSLVASLFGGDIKNPDDLLNKIKSDEQSQVKLKQLEIEHQEFLANNLLQQYKEQTGDLADARSRQVQMTQLGFHEWVMPILAILSMIQFWAYIIVSKFCNVSVDVTILTDLFAMAFMAFTFYFGSSHGERKQWTKTNSHAP